MYFQYLRKVLIKECQLKKYCFSCCHTNLKRIVVVVVVVVVVIVVAVVAVVVRIAETKLWYLSYILRITVIILV